MKRPQLEATNMGAASEKKLEAYACELEQELQARTRELSEAREQQRATAEILGVVSSSPADVQPVFDTIVRNFVRLCGSVFGCIYTFDGELVHFAGACGFTPEQLAEVKAKYPVRVDDPSVLSARAILTRAPVHTDVMFDAQYDRQHVAAARIRRLLAVPMLREEVPLGAIVSAWAEPGATPKDHEDLLKVFAAQAVIAIENTRLLNELRESLQQQIATSEVLQVISSSPGELKPVFDTILANAIRTCGARFGNLFVCEDDAFRIVARHNTPQALVEFFQRAPFRPHPDTPLRRATSTKRPAQRSTSLRSSSMWRGTPSRGRASSSAAHGQCSPCRCSRITNRSVSSLFSSRKCGHSPTSKSNWSRTSPRRRSSPSRTLGC
jgi:hypothetical protein